MTRVLMISGSTRQASTNSAFCRTAVTCAPDGVVVVAFTDLAELPHFSPDDDHDERLPAPVAKLRGAVAAANAVVFCSPEYAGTLPGSFKNLLDWMVGSTVLSDKPVAWVSVAEDARRGGGAADTLAVVLGYVQATVVVEACRHVPVAHDSVSADGILADPLVRARTAEVITAALGGRV